MTKTETGKFLNELAALYPNVIRKDSDLNLMATLWDEALKDCDYEDIHKALQDYFRTDQKGYVPTAGQLLEKVYGATGYEGVTLTAKETEEIWKTIV